MALNLAVIHYRFLNHCSPLGKKHLQKCCEKKKGKKRRKKRKRKKERQFSNWVELDLRWKRVGRNGDKSNTGKREKMGKARTSAEPVRLSATSNLHVPSSMPGKEKERDRSGGRAKKVDREKVGKAGTSGTVSHCLTLVSCPFFDARNNNNDQRKTEKSKQQRE